MDCGSIRYTGHALRRMFERSVSRAEVAEVIEAGMTIEDYPHEVPHPSCLLMAVVAGRPLHVVVARDDASAACVVVTVYEPDPTLWSVDWRTRRIP